MKYKFINIFLVSADIAYPYQLGFQDIGSSTMWAIVSLHDTISIYLAVILAFVIWMLYASIRYQWLPSTEVNNLMYYIIRVVWVGERLKHFQMLELVWTFIPCLVLLSIGMPSFIILYFVSSPLSATIYDTVRVIGHQWYWSYEYTFPESKGKYYVWKYDSYLKTETDLSLGEFRLLEVDNPLFLVAFENTRILVTSSDVLHSFAIPSLGIKIDAVPGRLNQVFVYPLRYGNFYGQCSELCGVDHGFMPIHARIVDFRSFKAFRALSISHETVIFEPYDLEPIEHYFVYTLFKDLIFSPEPGHPPSARICYLYVKAIIGLHEYADLLPYIWSYPEVFIFEECPEADPILPFLYWKHRQVWDD